MTIVKFKNGTYGIREWSWYHLTYVFLVKNRPGMHPKTENCVREYPTFEDASCACTQCMKTELDEQDMGTPVIKGHSLISK